MLGATGFGGPVALANYMCRDLVEKRAWIDEASYDRGLAIATACPGPMAYQLGVYCGFVTHGVFGALAVAVAFALPPFAIVVAAAALYERFAGAGVTRGLFYGIGPVVVALILRASWTLGRKTLKRDYAAWAVAVAACAVTIALQQEMVLLFLAAGVLGIFVFAPRAKPAPVPAPVAPKTNAFTLPAFLGIDTLRLASARGGIRARRNRRSSGRAGRNDVSDRAARNRRCLHCGTACCDASRTVRGKANPGSSVRRSRRALRHSAAPLRSQA